MTPEDSTPKESGLRPAIAAGVLCAAVFFIANVFSLGAKSLWIDEMRTGYAVLFAEHGSSLLRYLTLNDPASPLYSLLTVLWCGISGNSDFALRLPALVFGAASIILFPLLARRMVSGRAAIISTVVFAAMPNMVFYSGEARAYPAFVFLSIAAYILTMQAAEGKNSVPLMLLVFAAGMYVHIFFSFVIASCFLYALLFERRSAAKTVFLCAAVAALLYVPWIAAVMHGAGKPERLPGPELSFGMKILFLFGGLITGNAYSEIGVVTMAAFAALVLWLAGLLRCVRQSSHQTAKLMFFTIAPAAILLISFALFSRIYDMFHFRYILPVLPMLAIVIGAGISENMFAPAKNQSDTQINVKFSPARLFIAFCAFLYIYGTAHNIAAYVKSENQDWRGAYEYITKNHRQGDVIVLQGIANSSIKYYAEKNNKKFKFVATNSISDATEAFSDNPRCWYVYYKPRWGRQWLARTQRWLDSLGQRRKEFDGLYGSVVVGGSSSRVLVNSLSLKRGTEDNCALTVFVREKGWYGISSGDAGRRMSVELDRGPQDFCAFTRRGQRITIEKIVLVPVEDEPSGPEMRGYFLDWIRK